MGSHVAQFMPAAYPIASANGIARDKVNLFINNKNLSHPVRLKANIRIA